MSLGITLVIILIMGLAGTVANQSQTIDKQNEIIEQEELS